MHRHFIELQINDIYPGRSRSWLRRAQLTTDAALCVYVATRQTVQRRGDHLTNDMHRYQQQRQPLSSDPRLRRVCEMVWRYIVYNIPGCSMTLFIRYIINTVLQLYYLDVMNSSMNASFHIRSLNYWWIVTCVLMSWVVQSNEVFVKVLHIFFKFSILFTRYITRPPL